MYFCVLEALQNVQKYAGASRVVVRLHGEDDALIFDFATQLYETKRVADSMYENAVTRFGHVKVVNLVGLLGYYAMVAMTLNIFGMRAEGQTELPFPE